MEKMASFKMITKQTNPFGIYLSYSLYKGFVVLNFYKNAIAINGYIINDSSSTLEIIWSGVHII